MKTVFIVAYDWAFNGGAEKGMLGIYEELQDAIARMNQYWADEQAMEYFEKFDCNDADEISRSAWQDWEYADRHSEVRVFEQELYSHEDVINGRD